MKVAILSIIILVLFGGWAIYLWVKAKNGRKNSSHSSGRTEDPTNWRKKRDKDKLPTN